MTDFSDEFLQREIDDDRRGERALVRQALLALLFVAALVAVREWYLW